MISTTPRAAPSLTRRLAELDELHRTLSEKIAAPSARTDMSRHLARVTAVECSVGIEGFHVPRDEAVLLVGDTAAAPPDDADRMAVASYARALEHVVVMADDPDFRWLDRVILDLHFDTCRFQHDKRPGLWRDGPVFIVDGRGRAVYRAPDAGEVAGLMREVVEWLQDGDLEAHVVVRAAMAHLHLASVHPFRDGNGRIARIVQSLVLARGGLLPVEFASIEEYLGAHRSAYYAALQATHGERYDPSIGADSWVTFCVDAHVDQARRHLEEIAEAGGR